MDFAVFVCMLVLLFAVTNTSIQISVTDICVVVPPSKGLQVHVSN